MLLFYLLAVRSGDDHGRMSEWRVFLESGEGLLHQVLRTYTELNGRVIGNFLHFVLIDHVLLNAIVRAVISTALVWVVTRVTGVRAIVMLPVIAIATLAPSIPILSQAIIWSAGFYNYVVPVLLILSLALLLRSDAPRTWWRFVAVFLLAAASCLFMENVTLMTLVVAAAFFAFQLWQKRFTVLHGSAFAGLVVGAVLMFSSPVYRRIASGDDEYRAIAGGSADAASGSSLYGRITENLPPLSQQLTVGLAPMYLLVAIAIIVGVSNRPHRRWHNFLIGGLVAATATALLLAQVGKIAVGGRLQLLFALLVLGAGLAFYAFAVGTLMSANAKQFYLSAGWILAGLLYILPLIAVAPFGPRNFYFTSICLLIGALIASRGKIEMYLERRWAGTTFVVAGCVVGAGLLGLSGINKAVEIRNELSAQEQAAAGVQQIELRKYPFPTMVHGHVDPHKYARLFADISCSSSGCELVNEIEIKYR